MPRYRPGPAISLLAALPVASLMLTACGGSGPAGTTVSGPPVIAVTTPILGAVVADAVGDGARVEVVMPNGSDPHEWRPSARDVATLQEADLIIENGLGLEQGLTDAIARAREDGTPVFTATDHVQVRQVGAEESVGGAGEGEGVPGAADPHFWTDPTQMRRVVLALPTAVEAATGADITAPARREAAALAALDGALAARAALVPGGARAFVTGHESLGYLADRYGFRLVGAVTPSVSSQGQVSAAHLTALAARMERAGTRVVFTDTGTPGQVARAVADETGATVIDLPAHALPADGEYATFLDETMRRIAAALAPAGGQ